MQPQARSNTGVETSTKRPQINATHVLNHLNDFSRDFKRRTPNTTPSQTFSGIGPVVYDVDYTILHDPPQWAGDEPKFKKRKVTTEQRQSQRELSNIVGHGNKLADSFTKLDMAVINLRFDRWGSAPLMKYLAAGQRIALRGYIQNEIKKQAANLKLVRLSKCETTSITDVVESMVSLRRTMTKAEGNVFVDEIFEREFEFDNEDETGQAHMESYLNRSREIRNEISESIFDLQFDREITRIISHLLPLNYDSWPEEPAISKKRQRPEEPMTSNKRQRPEEHTTPRKIQGRRRMRRLNPAECAGGEHWEKL